MTVKVRVTPSWTVLDPIGISSGAWLAFRTFTLTRSAVVVL